jgi:hypothetical protein
MRNRTILFSLVAAWVLFAATPFAAADIIQDLTVKIDFQTCNNQLCMFDEGFDGAPASGYASFAQLGLPWSYAFVTPPPYWWCDSEQPECCGFWYQALFGQGGTFTMTGPDGLTFNGIVTSGWTLHPGPGNDQIQIQFSGQWSNGLSRPEKLSNTGGATSSTMLRPVCTRPPPPPSLSPVASCCLLLAC